MDVAGLLFIDNCGVGICILLLVDNDGMDECIAVIFGTIVY